MAHQEGVHDDRGSGEGQVVRRDEVTHMKPDHVAGSQHLGRAQAGIERVTQ